MPRFARTPFPGAVHHIISRFTNRTYRFNSSASELVHRRLSEDVASEMQQAATEIAAACRGTA